MTTARILIIEADPAEQTLAILLRNEGLAPEHVSSSAQAVERLEQGPDVALVVCDVLLNGMHGLQLLARIRADFPWVEVLFWSELNDARVAASAFRGGAADYLLKQCDTEELLDGVRRALERGLASRQEREYRQNLEEVISARTGLLRSTMQDLQRSYDVTLEAMGDALDLRDAETEGHSRRVTAYAIELAMRMGFDEDAQRTIARGAFLHDIGKISTPDCVLLKPGKLDDRETEIMREHCERGYEMVRKIPFLREASEIVHAHQECFDGSGYPRGLRGTEIPLGARIFAVADALDAITSDRPYRRRRSLEEAAEEIRRCAGRQFDPAVVQVFLTVPLARWRELRLEASSLTSLPRPVGAPRLRVMNRVAG